MITSLPLVSLLNINCVWDGSSRDNRTLPWLERTQNQSHLILNGRKKRKWHKSYTGLCMPNLSQDLLIANSSVSPVHYCNRDNTELGILSLKAHLFVHNEHCKRNILLMILLFQTALSLITDSCTGVHTIHTVDGDQ